MPHGEAKIFREKKKITGKNVQTSLYLIVSSHRDYSRSLCVKAAYLSDGQE